MVTGGRCPLLPEFNPTLAHRPRAGHRRLGVALGHEGRIMTRVVVTGATGNVGTSLVELLTAGGADVVGVARHIPEGSRADVHWVGADVAETDLVTLFRGADAVVHLAWLIQPSHRPAELWRTNVVGSTRVIEAVERAGVPALVHASSIGAYSPGAFGRRVDESWPTEGNPSLGYAWQKAYVERLLDALAQRRPEVRVVRLRPALIFKREAAARIHSLFLGPMLPRWTLSTALAPWVERSPVPLQVVHTFDVAQAFRHAVERDVRGAFNVATEPVLGATGRSTPAVVFAARRLSGALWRAHVLRAEPGWVQTAGMVPLLDTARIRAELDWEPVYDARTTVRELLEGMHQPNGLAAELAAPAVS
jgi:nucleoside-diphosphate-sugar epimerase